MIRVGNKSCHMISLIKTKGRFNIMSKGMRFEDVPMSADDQLVGKYKSTSHKDGVNYARIWYNGDEISPEYTYTQKYLKEHKLGKYTESEAVVKESKKSKKKSSKESKETDLSWLFTWPFKLIWWLIKKIFSLVGLSFLIALFSSDNEDK